MNDQVNKPKGSADFTPFTLEPRIINGEEVMVKVYDYPGAAKERARMAELLITAEEYGNFIPTGEQMKQWLGYNREDDK